MVLIYAFTNQWGTNISRRTLLELQKLLSSPSSQKGGSEEIIFQLVNFPKPFFKKYIDHNIYDLIIGLGDGSDFLSKIKIETQAKNNYLNSEIYPFSPIFLDFNLPPVDIYDSQNFKIGANMGTYNCNYLAYSTQLYLNQHSPDTFHLFLHLPKKQNALFLAQNILKLIKDNQIIFS